MADRVGQRLGNYRLVRLLGQGGFAEVYLGEHVYLGKQAAVKVLHTQLHSSDVESFRLEAQRVSNLEHPHIVSIFDFGVDGTTPFLVMGYAPGGTLRQRHPKGSRLPLPTIVSYVKQVGEALQHAHDQKLIHRDIKPENMFIGRRNELLLGDFGIAAVVHSTSSMSAQMAMGTISYMAPEQIQEHPRPASDQYALGIVVYEWLCGELPFHGSLTEIMAKHMMVPPPSLRKQLPTLSPEVEQVVMTALAKEPRQRFGQVQAFVTALEQASQVEVSEVIPASRSPQLRAEPNILSPSQPSPEPLASVSQSSVPTELVTPVSQSSIPTQRSTPANPTSFPALPVENPAASRSIPQHAETKPSTLAREQRIGFITAIIGNLVTLSSVFLPYLSLSDDSFVTLLYNYGSSLGPWFSMPVYVSLTLFLGATILAGSQLFNSSAHLRKNAGRLLIVYGWLEMIVVQFYYNMFNSADTFSWGVGVWVSQLGILLTIAGGIVAQTDHWHILTSPQRVGSLVVWVSRAVTFVAYLLPYFYVEFRYNGFVEPHEISGVEFLHVFPFYIDSVMRFLLFEAVIVVVAWCVSRKVLLAIGVLGIVYHLLLMFLVLSQPYPDASSHWEIAIWLYPLGMIGLMVGAVLTMKGTKHPLATANTRA
jgi:serine/threonine protein kinase